MNQFFQQLNITAAQKEARDLIAELRAGGAAAELLTGTLP
jgi:hypothetical protein